MTEDEFDDELERSRKVTLPSFREALRKLRPIFKRHGFTYEDDLIPNWKDTFRKYIGGTRIYDGFRKDSGNIVQVVGFSFEYHCRKIELRLTYILYLRPIECLWEGLNRAYCPFSLPSIGHHQVTEIGSVRIDENVTSEAIYRFLSNSYKNFGQPFFEAHDSLEKIERALNTNPKVYCPLADSWHDRAFWGLSLARLVGNPRYQELKTFYQKYGAETPEYFRYLEELEKTYPAPSSAGP